MTSTVLDSLSFLFPFHAPCTQLSLFFSCNMQLMSFDADAVDFFYISLFNCKKNNGYCYIVGIFLNSPCFRWLLWGQMTFENKNCFLWISTYMYNQSERTGSHVASSNVFIVFHNRKLSALYHGKPVNSVSLEFHCF